MSRLLLGCGTESSRRPLTSWHRSPDAMFETLMPILFFAFATPIDIVEPTHRLIEDISTVAHIEPTEPPLVAGGAVWVVSGPAIERWQHP